MKTLGMALLMAAGAATLAASASPEPAKGQGEAVVTVLPKKNLEAPVNITAQDLQVKVNGKESSVTNWVPLRGERGDLELVVLIDSSARTSLGEQLNSIANFIQGLPPNVKAGVAYMQNGRAALASPLSADHDQVVRGLHLPVGFAGSSGGPYFCLSDLAQHWPSGDHAARHEVVMITDGVDNYDRRYDPDDPYVQTAVRDVVQAGLVVYSIYWRDRGLQDNSLYGATDGQNLISQVTQATGGENYWIGTGDPVSFKPYFENISLRLQNQYRLSFDSGLNGKPQVENMNLKVGGPASKVYAPQQVYVTHPAGE